MTPEAAGFGWVKRWCMSELCSVMSCDCCKQSRERRMAVRGTARLQIVKIRCYWNKTKWWEMWSRASCWGEDMKGLEEGHRSWSSLPMWALLPELWPHVGLVSSHWFSLWNQNRENSLFSNIQSDTIKEMSVQRKQPSCLISNTSHCVQMFCGHNEY